MFCKKKLFFVFFIIAAFLGTLHAEENSTNKNIPENAFISQIEYEGLKKTKKSYMDSILERYKEKPLTEQTLKEIETILQVQGVFSEVDFRYEKDFENSPIETGENPFILVVLVKEKITLIPLPFASYSSDGFMGGFMLMNMNAFGTKSMLVSSGIFSSSMQMAMLTFQKPAKLRSTPGFSTFASFSNREEEITDFSDETLFNYDVMQLRGMFSVQERFSKNFSASVGANYAWYNIYSGDLDSLHYWGLSSSLHYNTVNWNNWFLISSGAFLQGKVGYETDDGFSESFGLGGNFQFPIVPRIRVSLSASAYASSKKTPVLQFDKGSVGSSIMNSNFKTERIAGSMLSLEGALFKKKIATLSLYSTYEFDMAQDCDESFVYCTGPGAGIKLYLQQIAFPAMNMGFSYNINQNFFKFVISVGMSF